MVAVDDLVRGWEGEIARLSPRLRELVITAYLGDLRYFTFELGEEYFEAIAEAGFEVFLFPDHGGYFEDEVPRDEVPRRVVELFGTL
ncbi:hypothetical protein [Umezawaea endophytica]|uniref:Uncharacterized protein n=1 Tax=Umezawaea endophytica TaxID=1654476 RepID=A0A9X2VFX0_9PSEU|nr:hypothetical protein [Umezawaea endophytica]MCS7475404.1 hypothetical protein [Umezawaea endophytica]